MEIVTCCACLLIALAFYVHERRRPIDPERAELQRQRERYQRRRRPDGKP